MRFFQQRPAILIGVVLVFASSAADAAITNAPSSDTTDNSAASSSRTANAGTAEATNAGTANETACAEVYGPINMLKTLHSPFMSVKRAGTVDNSPACSIDSPISIEEDAAGGKTDVISEVERNLSHRLAGPRLYLPGRLVMGRPAEFVVKGKPGCYAALAMADRDSGAKPIHGHTIHLGPDRKVVSVGKISAGGLLHLWIEAPFEGDLIGLPLYFEAVVWSQEDFSDLQIASPVKCEFEGTQAAGNFDNGVIMAAGEGVLKEDPLVVHESTESTEQHLQYTGPRLDSGRP